MRFFYNIIKPICVVIFVILISVKTPRAVDSNVTPLQMIFMIKQLIPQTQALGLLWNQTKINSGEYLPKIERASASMGVKVIVEDVEELSDISQKFRDLKDNYHVQAVWVFDNSDPLNSNIAKDFLIKNTIVNGIALFAPNTDWVSAGACASLLSDGSTVKLYVNKKTINALGIKVPDKYLQDTQFIATN
ncbi:MAG TPA: ABC transporter substrate binding protein [Candidatus Acidoferrales bacterium]|nr:ABC transporter substrate binding protein [Candidatus Acidoferrales bacterium]